MFRHEEFNVDDSHNIAVKHSSTVIVVDHPRDRYLRGPWRSLLGRIPGDFGTDRRSRPIPLPLRWTQMAHVNSYGKKITKHRLDVQ